MRYSIEPRNRKIKKFTMDAIKTASKTTIQKTTEATGDLIGNKIADKITSISKKSTKTLPTGCMFLSYHVRVSE